MSPCTDDYSSDFQQIHGLYWHPVDTTIILLATNTAFYRTTDGGQSWTKNDDLVMRDLQAHPTNPDILYAWGFYNNSKTFMYSLNNGGNWQFTYLPDQNAHRAVIGVSPADPDVVYLATATHTDLNFLFKSVNRGLSFSTVAMPNKPPSAQTSYNFAMTVDPQDINTLYLGTIGIYKSTNGGINWTSITYNSHVDFHELSFIHGSLYAGNDGGVYRLESADRWEELNNQLAITQYYRVSGSETDSTIMLAGSQDNGTHKFNLAWEFVLGSDGMDNAIDPTDPSIMYMSSQYGNFSKSTNGGLTTETMLGPSQTGISGVWVTPFAIDPQTPAVLYAGYDKLWKSVNYGNTWFATSPPLYQSGVKITAFDISFSNPNVIYASAGLYLYSSSNGGLSWTQLTNLAIYIRRIEIDPNDPQHLWIVGSQKIYESNDGGANWQNINLNLPDGLSLHTVVYDRDTDEHLFLGTSIGVYYKTATMNSWQLYSNQLPNVPVIDLEIIESFNKLRAATYGRGVWESYTLDYNGCYDSIYVSNNIQEGIHAASKHISSDAIQFGGSEAEFRAGQSIQLAPMFEVKQSAIFSAFIEECPEVNDITQLELADGYFCQTAIIIDDLIGTRHVDAPIQTSANFGETSWFAFKPESKYWIDILSCEGGANTTLRVYTGDCSGLFPQSEVNNLCSKNGGSDTDAAGIYELYLSPFNTYYFEWEVEDGSTMFSFDINVSDSTGYYCTTATSIEAGEPSFSDPGQNGGTYGTGANWFSYTPSSTGTIDITSCNGGGDTNLNIWEGDCNSLILIANNDGECALNEEEPDMRAAALYNIPVTANENYLIEWNDQDDYFEFYFQLIEHF